MKDEKQFAKVITKMFRKQSILRERTDVVTDGMILYKGYLRDDIFYRLRLESSGQQKLLQDNIDEIFGDAYEAEEVDVQLLYTLPKEVIGDEIDVYIVGNAPTNLCFSLPYMAFNKKYRKLFVDLPNAEYLTKYTPPSELSSATLQEGMRILCEYGEVIVMPIHLAFEQLYN